jgi:hypothetical protein
LHWQGLDGDDEGAVDAPSAGRLANHLEIHIEKLSALTLAGVETRNYRKNPRDAQAQGLQLKKAA